MITALCLKVFVLISLYVLVISAMTSALVHGGNDVANCIGPFVVIYLVFQVIVVLFVTNPKNYHQNSKINK